MSPSCRLVQLFFFIAFILLFLFPKHATAASLNLSSNQSQIGQNDTYNVNVSLSIGSANGTQYFLRGAFYAVGTTSYCGYTYNGSAWYNGPYTTNNGWQQLLPITVQNSSWSGTLKAKLDSNDSGCQNSGTYNFKIQRFTQSGSGTFDTQNEQTVWIVLPTPISTPTSTPTAPPTNMLQSTPTQKPTFITVPTTIKPSALKITLLPAVSSESASISGEVLSSSTSPTLIAGIAEKKKSSFNWLAVFFIIGGIFLLSSCGILLYYWRKGKLFHANE